MKMDDKQEIIKRLYHLEEWAEDMSKHPHDPSQPERDKKFFRGYAEGVRDVITILGGDPMRELKRRFERAGIPYDLTFPYERVV